MALKKVVVGGENTPLRPGKRRDLPGFLKSPLSFLNLLNLEVYQRNPEKGFMTADGRGGQPETKNKTKFEKKMYR